MDSPSKPEYPKVVLFDMDDTLFDHRYALRHALTATWRTDRRLSGRRLGDLLAEYERLLEEIHPDVLAGRKTHAEARRERFRRLYDWAGSPLSDDEAESAARRYRSAYQSSRRAVPGAPELLRWLNGRTQVGIVSNNHTAEQQDKMRAIDLGGSTPFLVTSEQVGVGKPDPRIFRHALDLAGAAPGDAVMVGDNWEADIAGAQASGIRPVWLNREGRSAPGPSRGVAVLNDLRPRRVVAATILEGANRRPRRRLG